MDTYTLQVVSGGNNCFCPKEGNIVNTNQIATVAVTFLSYNKYTYVLPRPSSAFTNLRTKRTRLVDHPNEAKGPPQWALVLFWGGFHNTVPKIGTCPRMAPETKKRLVCGMQFYYWLRPKVGFRHCLPSKSRENCDWAGGRRSDDAIPADRVTAIGRGVQIHFYSTHAWWYPYHTYRTIR